MRHGATRCLATIVCGSAAVLFTAPPVSADSIRDKQWHLAYLNVAAAHAINQGDGVVVAVVDSGVSANHPDLAGNVMPGVDVSGTGALNGSTDLDGHGTGMAGLIAGHGHGNGNGVLGIAPHAKIYPVRDGQSKGPTSSDTLTAGINAAVTSGAKIISISQGGSNTAAMQRAIQSALAADIVVVASIGNKPEALLPVLPAAYDGVVAVGATDQDGNIAIMSVTGPEMVLTAPGTRIVSTDKTGYSIGDGTSDSTAIVAGAAALIRSKYPNLSAKDVVHRLTATATDKGPPGRDPQYGYGVLNLVAALTADVPPLAPSTAPSRTGTAAAPTVGATNAARPDNNKGTGSGAGIIIAAAAVVVLAGAAAVGWVLLRRRGRPPVP